jgi:hypothetical protein
MESGISQLGYQAIDLTEIVFFAFLIAPDSKSRISYYHLYFGKQEKVY